MPVQLEAALDVGDIDTAYFCLRSWIMQAVSEHTVGMYRVQGRARRAYEKYQMAIFLDRLKRHRPDIHEMLRKPRSTHQTPVTAEGWSSYLQCHFGARMSNCSPSNRATTHTHGM
eukprot:140787-Pelagomonas_calceolata.AAC.1